MPLVAAQEVLRLWFLDKIAQHGRKWAWTALGVSRQMYDYLRNGRHPSGVAMLLSLEHVEKIAIAEGSTLADALHELTIIAGAVQAERKAQHKASAAHARSSARSR